MAGRALARLCGHKLEEIEIVLFDEANHIKYDWHSIFWITTTERRCDWNKRKLICYTDICRVFQMAYIIHGLNRVNSFCTDRDFITKR